MKRRENDFYLVATAASWDRLQVASGRESNAERMAFGYCSASSSIRGIRLLLRGLDLPCDEKSTRSITTQE